jgi:hypothetical protein
LPPLGKEAAVKQRLPLVLSATALVVALFGSTPLGHAVVSAVPPFAKKAGYAKTAGNALAVNGIKAAKEPTPGFLVPLGADGKFPASIGQGGPAGPKGDKGDKGPKGDKGDVGPSKAYYSHGSILDGLPPGDYIVYGQLFDDNRAGATSGNAGVSLGIRLAPGGSAQSSGSSGYVSAGGTVTLPVEAILHLPNGGGVGANTSTYGTFQVDLTAVRVGSATP